jgi:site-specific recombinase XerD
MPFETTDIKNDPYVKDFLRSRRIRDTTKVAYVERLTSFCNYINKNPTDLIDEAEEEQDKGIKSRKRTIRQYFLDFIEHEEKEGKSHHTIKARVELAKSFYHSFDIETPKFSLNYPNVNRSFNEIPTLDHIREIIKICGLRDTAIILLMLSSGMGGAEIRHLTYNDFINSIEEYLDLADEDKVNINKVAHQIRGLNEEIGPIGTWKISRFKTGMPYITFNSPESVLSIIDYLLERELKNKGVKSLDDPLFVSSHKNQISKQGFVFIFRRINDNAGLGFAKDKNRRFFTSHMPRKIFTSTLYSQGVDKTRVDWFLGHKIPPITESYFKTNVEDLKKSYMEIVEHLTLQKIKIKTIKTPEYDQLLRDSREKADKIEAMEKRMELYEKLIENEDLRKDLAE